MTSSVLVCERETLHISDDSGRITMLENRTVGTAADDNNTAASLTRYVYSNHLQSASLELDENAAIISYEEYHPYGTTAYQAVNASINAVAKRYRYTGKERDEESGLYYHGARYYIPWLVRWCAVDAMQDDMPTWSPYNYGFCNPVIFNDPSGDSPEGGDDKFVNGYTVKTVILDKEGNAMPEGTKLPYSEEHTNTMLTEHKKNLDKGEVEAGSQVLQEAEGEGGMQTVTVTYRLGWGAREGKLLLWGYEQNYERYSEPVKEQLPVLPQPIESNPITVLRDDTPSVDAVKLKPVKPKVQTTKPEKPALPMALNASQIPSWATSYDKMSSEMYVLTHNIARQYKNTDAVSLNITVFLPNNVLSDRIVERAGALPFNKQHNRYVTERFKTDYYRDVGPGTKEKPGINNNKTHKQNVLGQVNEFQSVLRTLLPGVRVNVISNQVSNTSRITINPIRRRR